MFLKKTLIYPVLLAFTFLSSAQAEEKISSINANCLSCHSTVSICGEKNKIDENRVFHCIRRNLYFQNTT